MIQPEEMTRPIKNVNLREKLAGKTIKSIDNSACNVLGIEFEDGYCINITHEYICVGLYGIVCEERLT
jgi:hypothetical protein